MAVIIGWDPERGAHLLPLFRSAAASIEVEGRGATPWPTAPGSDLRTGVRVHLMLQGAERGIVGIGTVRSAPFLSFTGRNDGVLVPHVTMSWVALLPEEERISTDELLTRVPGIAWDLLYLPEITLDAEAAARLERAWLAPHPSVAPGPARRAASRRLARRGDPALVPPLAPQARWSKSAAAL